MSNTNHSNQTILKIAAEEIKDVLRKHNMAGAIALHLPGHGEFFIHLNTPYSCVHIIDDEQIRIHSKAENYKTKEEQFLSQQNSSNMLRVLTDLSGMNYIQLEALSEQLDKAVGAEHSPGKISKTSKDDK